MPKPFPSGLWLSSWLLTRVFASRKPILSHEVASAFTLLFGIFGLITGLYFFFRGFLLLQQKKWIEDTPVTKIAAAAIGQAKVFGKATGPYTLLSPLAMVDCHYYRAVAWNGRDAEDEGKPEGRATETMFTPLFVEDESGMLMIDPRGARLELPPEYDEQISGDSMAEGSRRFLHRHGLSTTGGTTVTEYTIKPGDPLLVLGTLEENRLATDNAVAYLSREAADLQRREQLEAMGIPRCDIPASTIAAASNFDLRPRVTLGRGNGHLPFLLSRQHPQRIVDNFQRRAVLGIWGGPALALFSLVLLLKWLGKW